MFGIGAEELVVIFVIALFVLGPERLPSLARDIGKAVRELRRASDELTEQFLRADEPRPEPSPASLPAQTPTPAPAETPVVTAESSAAEDTTEFDRKAQEDADRARERGELAPGAPAQSPPHEPERWG
jgi:TatA/E family protein of Tat protein translocase